MKDRCSDCINHKTVKWVNNKQGIEICSRYKFIFKNLYNLIDEVECEDYEYEPRGI